jgi:hypothetical protein
MQKNYTAKLPKMHSNSIQVPLRDEGQAAKQRTGRSQDRIVCFKKRNQKDKWQAGIKKD